jgi:hypothetical protein
VIGKPFFGRKMESNLSSRANSYCLTQSHLIRYSAPFDGLSVSFCWMGTFLENPASRIRRALDGGISSKQGGVYVDENGWVQARHVRVEGNLQRAHILRHLMLPAIVTCARLGATPTCPDSCPAYMRCHCQCRPCEGAWHF